VYWREVALDNFRKVEPSCTVYGLVRRTSPDVQYIRRILPNKRKTQLATSIRRHK
jgi:hypothetical protein